MTESQVMPAGSGTVSTANESETPQSLDAAFAELFASDDSGLFDEPIKPQRLTSDDRLERAFLEIVEFVDKHGREPDPDTRDIGERKLGARLVGIRGNDEKTAALAHLDTAGLLNPPATGSGETGSIEELLEELLEDDLADNLGADDDLFDMSALPKAASPERAERVKAKDFHQFKPLFAQKHQELRDGVLTTGTFTSEGTIKEGKFYLLRGMLAFVTEIYAPEQSASTDHRGRPKQRLRVVFENGTESSMYVASLASRLYEEDGRVLIEAHVHADNLLEEDTESGHLYVLESLSDNPDVRSIDNLHKIGFTRGTVAERIRGAEKSATYLYAPVKVVADYRLYNIRPSVLEHLLHEAFREFRVDVMAQSAEGVRTTATEWFVASLEMITSTLEDIITRYRQRYAGDAERPSHVC